MAFNPFHQFRRHSKKLFAVLAIVCMFTFVISSGMGGRGDLFNTLTDWIGTSSDVRTIISVGGKKFDAQQVEAVRNQRQLASDYMDAAVAAAQSNLIGRINAGLEKLDPSARQVAQRIVQTKMFAMLAPSMAQQYAELVRNAPVYDSFLVNLISTADREKRSDDVATLTSVRALLLQDYRQLSRRPGESFFGGPIRDRDFDATADFLLWQHEADQLGIQLLTGDVQQLIAQETLGELRAENAANIDKYLRGRYRGGYSVEALYAALGNELRARMAQGAFLGTSMRTRTASPAMVTPQEQWDLFKDARTTIRAGLIEIPVNSFLDKVTTTPTEEELKTLFEKYKNDEPAPFLERPGFKEPRQIQVEWVSGRPDTDFYQKAATQLAPVFQAMRLLAISNPIEASLAPLMLDFELYDAQRKYVAAERPWSDHYFPRLHDTSIVRAENLKSLVGALMGAGGTGAPILSAPLALEASALASETLDRSQLGLGLIGLGANDAFAPAWAAVALTPRPLGLDVLRQSLLQQANTNLATALFEADLLAFRNKVAELGKEKDKSALNKTVNEFIAQRGMYRGTTTQSRDIHGVPSDPGLAALKDVYLRTHQADDPLAHRFGAAFFLDPAQTNGVTTFNPQEFMPRRFDDTRETKYLFWLTEDREARVPRFDKAKPLVVEAWKRERARELAKKAADDLLVKVKQAQGDVPKLRDLAAQNGDRTFFELGPMARAMPVPSIDPTAARRYQAPTIPPDRIEFPSQELFDGLLNLRKEPRGAVALLSDLPKAHFYVTSLLFRDEPTQDEFRRAYIGSMNRAVEGDLLLRELTMDVRIKNQRETVKQMRELAQVKINTGNGLRPANEPSASPEPAAP
jgi:hypothetical protein